MLNKRSLIRPAECSPFRTYVTVLTNSFIADPGMDFENPSPLHVFVGVLTSSTTTFLCMAKKKKDISS